MNNTSSLTFKFIANASGIFIGSEGTSILCDPWLVDGVFEGSWCHFPPLSTKIDDVKDVDAIYISHLHPDHFDERNFEFDKSKPLIVLDHGPNFLIKKLELLGFKNLIKIRDGQTKKYKEFALTMFAPFAKHNFHDAKIGNLIDSALLIECNGLSALNANDNTPTIEAAEMLREKYGSISLAMINYNAAGPYPSCFDNLTKEQKIEEHSRILKRNFEHLKSVIEHMQPKFLLPFAGAYVLGGSLHEKNEYLGTTTWDECAQWIKTNYNGETDVVLLRENDSLNIQNGQADKEYISIVPNEMKDYIVNQLSKIKYPYQNDDQPNIEQLTKDLEIASKRMLDRCSKFNIESSFKVLIGIEGTNFQIYPQFEKSKDSSNNDNTLLCNLDLRLLRRILDRKSHWNNAEIGAHISFIRTPNTYEPDLHTALQFLHL